MKRKGNIVPGFLIESLALGRKYRASSANLPNLDRIGLMYLPFSHHPHPHVRNAQNYQSHRKIKLSQMPGVPRNSIKNSPKAVSMGITSIFVA
jgi:hypothetical protein